VSAQNRSASASEQASIRYTNSSLNPVVHEGDSLTLVVDNQSTPSAQVLIEIYVALGA
jgi:hypothetical protein